MMGRSYIVCQGEFLAYSDKKLIYLGLERFNGPYFESFSVLFHGFKCADLFVLSPVQCNDTNVVGTYKIIKQLAVYLLIE